jgi:plasmid stabilization system protein ParE
MIWTVVWLDDAEDQLAATYLLAVQDRRAAECTSASDRVEALLRQAPNSSGESRGRRGRMLFERPIAVTFEVHEPERVVVVLRVQYLIPRQP